MTGTTLDEIRALVGEPQPHRIAAVVSGNIHDDLWRAQETMASMLRQEMLLMEIRDLLKAQAGDAPARPTRGRSTAKKTGGEG